MTVHDLVVVGAGPGGLSAAMQSARLGLRTCVVERSALGGQLVNIPELDSLPGVPAIVAGWDLAATLTDEAQESGVPFEFGEIDTITPEGETWTVAGRGLELSCRAVVVATGTDHATLSLDREDELHGRGVSYCASCDGPLFPGRPVAVVGGDDVALREARYLAPHASEVFVLLPDDEPTASAVRRAELAMLSNVHLIPSTTVSALLGADSVAGVRFTEAGVAARELEVGAVFVALRRTPNVSVLTLELGADGGLAVDASMGTSGSGAYAVGDVRSCSTRQVATAIGDGFVAAHAVHRLLASPGGLPPPRSDQPRGATG